MLLSKPLNFNWGGGQTYTPITSYFHDKAKISKENLRVDYYLLLKCSKKQCTLLPTTWTKSLTIKIEHKNARCWTYFGLK